MTFGIKDMKDYGKDLQDKYKDQLYLNYLKILLWRL